MAKIKIISNPYKKEVEYYVLNEMQDAWQNICDDIKNSSDLLKEKYVSGFFPFKAKEIVDIIYNDYKPDNIEICFQGTSDEYKELEDVCVDDLYEGKVTVKKIDADLSNARDILPKVKHLFQEMSPLIAQSVSQDKIERDLSRFVDAASDVVPICVMGNYSAGKSTFINALIGNEILPSGNETVTAKIYKISRSHNPYTALVRCKYLNYDIVITYTDNNTSFSEGLMENELSILLKDSLEKIKEASLVERVNHTLHIINDFERDDEEAKISDLIEVEIPFAKGVLAKTDYPFVIFDTPGSNSASNEKHVEVLKKAMANMTNGLPIILTTADSMNSNDNEEFYHLMLEMEELDKRFTMIVVNKADGAGIQRRGATLEEQERIKKQVIPRNLYSGGLFYVSSILGLGSKNGGKFLDYIYDDIYDAQVNRYIDPTNDHYKTLYLFNIQPTQLKKRSDELAMQQQDDLIYVNSGLFTIETEIDTFAGKYSAYNKCFQSQLFLTKVIRTTEQEIEEKRVECEENRRIINEKLESDKKILLDELERVSREKSGKYVESYPDYMSPNLDNTHRFLSIEDIKKLEEHFIGLHEKQLAYDDQTEEAKKARESVAENLKENVKKVFNDFNVSNVKTVFTNLQSDVGNAVESYQAQRDTRHKADKQGADSLLNDVKTRYRAELQDISNLLDQKSRAYWENSTENLRNELVKLVVGSEVLTEDRRRELERIIVNYKKVEFSDNESQRIFEKKSFEKRIRIGELEWAWSPHLNIDKLSKEFNTKIGKGTIDRYEGVRVSHQECVFNWIQDLMDVIRENIVEYSPELSKQAKQIRAKTEEIHDLEQRMEKLDNYTNELYKMMDWKIAE